MNRSALLLAFLSAACATNKDNGYTGPSGDTGSPIPPEDTGPGPLVFDDEAAEILCADPATADLMVAALDLEGINSTYVEIQDDELATASYDGYLTDNFLLPWYWDVASQPTTVACAGSQIGADLDYAMATPHPVASAIGEAMDLLEVPRELEPVQPEDAEDQNLADLTGLPDDLKAALQPILAALNKAAYARAQSAATSPVFEDDLVESGQSELMWGTVEDPLPLWVGPNQEWIIEDTGPRRLFDVSRVLAYAIEEANLMQFAGTDASLDLTSSIGRIVVTGSGNDAPDDDGTVALWLDLGGDDTWTYPAGASDEDVPVSVHIDLGGNDTYTYTQTDAGTLRDDGYWDLLPSDEYGRYDPYEPYYGAISASWQGRQGSGRFGIGMLFDMAGDDVYMSPRMSQGWAHLGVGVLYDASGNDVYSAEEAAQGATSNGIGLLLDAAGDDVYRSYVNSQGFSWLSGVGIAYDSSGNDLWYANPGTVDPMGTALYYDGNMTGEGNPSFSQGASRGLQGDYTYTYLSGGVGVVRDLAGDDTYVSSSFAQGMGYWQALGMLSDGGGADTYDGHFVVQGAGAFYGTGVLLDEGDGDDQYGAGFTASLGYHLGFGYELSVGVVVDEGGDDIWTFTDLAAGFAYSGSVAMLIDNSGDDIWTSTGTSVLGYGESGGTEADSIGIFIDAGGNDAYDSVLNALGADNDAGFGSTGGGSYTYGVGLDGTGESGVHAGPL